MFLMAKMQGIGIVKFEVDILGQFDRDLMIQKMCAFAVLKII